MSIVSVSCVTIFEAKWKDWHKPTVTLRPNILKVGNTYLMIFARHQEVYYNALMAVPNLKIVYQSIPATNRIHPGPPRIFVVVFEPQEEAVINESNSQPLPQVPI